jgi:hypothetical protein
MLSVNRRVFVTFPEYDGAVFIILIHTRNFKMAAAEGLENRRSLGEEVDRIFLLILLLYRE